MSEWKPIESAPKDGTDFLALIPWQRKHHQMVGCFAPDGKFHSWPGRSVYAPTHWQPLPAPPATLDPRDPDPSREGMFRDHSCARCQSGAKPCVNGDPRRCEFPRARND